MPPSLPGREGPNPSAPNSLRHLWLRTNGLEADRRRLSRTLPGRGATLRHHGDSRGVRKSHSVTRSYGWSGPGVRPYWSSLCTPSPSPRTPNPASIEAQTVVSGSRRRSADMARRSPSGRRPLGSAQVMHQVVPQRSTQLRRRAHAVHPRGGAARPETPVSCNSLIPLRSCPPRPTP